MRVRSIIATTVIVVDSGEGERDREILTCITSLVVQLATAAASSYYVRVTCERREKNRIVVGRFDRKKTMNRRGLSVRRIDASPSARATAVANAASELAAICAIFVATDAAFELALGVARAPSFFPSLSFTSLVIVVVGSMDFLFWKDR